MSAAEKAPGAVVIGSGQSWLAGKRTLLVVLGVVVVLGIAAGGTYIWLNSRDGKKSTDQTQTNTQQHLTPAQMVAAAQAQVGQADTPTKKQQAYTALGDAYQAAGQSSRSSSAYQQALIYAPDDIPLLERLSGEYEDAGDKVNAAKTLQKLIAALQASNIPDKDFLLSRYQAELVYVQGGH